MRILVFAIGAVFLAMVGLSIGVAIAAIENDAPAKAVAVDNQSVADIRNGEVFRARAVEAERLLAEAQETLRQLRDVNRYDFTGPLWSARRHPGGVIVTRIPSEMLQRVFSWPQPN